MRFTLSAPSQLVFLVSVVIAVLVVLVRYAGVSIPWVSGNVFEALLIAYAILVAGTLLRGI